MKNQMNELTRRQMLAMRGGIDFEVTRGPWLSQQGLSLAEDSQQFAKINHLALQAGLDNLAQEVEHILGGSSTPYPMPIPR